jgi:hypothetical protein
MVALVDPNRSPSRRSHDAEVADKDDLVEAVEAMKSIIPDEVTVVEVVEAGCGVSHWSVLHRHRCHRTTVPSHLRRRSRGCENACYCETKENEFFPVHSVIRFKKLNPVVIQKYRLCRIGKGNAVVTISMRR